MPRNLASARVALLAGLFLATSGASAGIGPCPPNRPVVSGPSEVHRLEGYWITWTNVLSPRGSGQPDSFLIERSEDPTFQTGVDRLPATTRTIATWGPSGGAPRMLYHRVAVQSFCAGTSPVRVESAVFAVRVTDQCRIPIALTAPLASPALPPANTTYIVSWDTLGAGEPGPGGGAQGLRFRLRRTAGGDVTESLIDDGAAAFTDPPGEYLYQVRTENICGDVSPWSEPARVVVGATKTSALFLVSAPRSVLMPADAQGEVRVAFVVRNAGSEPLDVTATGGSAGLAAEPSTFRLESGRDRRVEATLTKAPSAEVPFHGAVVLTAKGDVSLRVPIDVATRGVDAGGGPSGEPGTSLAAGWEEDAVDVDRNGNDVTRRLVNPGTATAYLATSVSAPWLVVSSADGKVWDRPLAPGESRAIWLRVDRSLRRAAIGTEIATVTVVTAGHEGEPKSLSVIDDGPQVTGVGSPSADDDIPPLYLMKSRLLFPSLPNAMDARGAGRYTSDLWLSNVDALNAIQVVLTLTPAGQSNTSAGVRQFAFSLGAGETRRFRNVIGTIFGYEGGCSLDVSSPSPTLSATALVNNKPVVPLVAGKTAALGTAVAGTLLSTAEFGFEMRPVAPGEGASQKDPEHVVSGLWHDARRRTNLILRETTGNETTVRLELFDGDGRPVLRDGAAFDREVKVPAHGSMQLNDDELFPDGEFFPEALRAKVTFLSGSIDPFGQTHGGVVPLATVIDSGTQDAALRVGVSERSLSPVVPEGAPALRALSESPLPFDGGPEALYFPAAHVTGAALSSGRAPRWRTRVTFANVSDTEDRDLRLRFVDESGNLPGGTPITATVLVQAGQSFTLNDVLESRFLIPPGTNVWGTVAVDAIWRENGSGWDVTWADVDVQTETYTADTEVPSRGEFRTGMEAYSYRHGYSSFQSNLGTVLIDGAEISARNRTNLILQEVGGASCTLAVGVYRPGALVPLAVKIVELKASEYVSQELFRGLMQLDLDEIVDARVVVRQIDGDGVFMAFVSKINLVTGDPANVFLRPASAGTGR
ncbi:MAG: hypothetical protein ACYDBY_15360 [Thermoanaerobaculia bacterium]